MKYKKKPIVIEAYQLGMGHAVPDWFMNALSANQITTHSQRHSPFDASPNPTIVAKIETLEGVMTAQYQDFIIRGIEGEIYPCKPDIFAATYEYVA